MEAPCVSPYVLLTVAGAPCDRLILLLNVPLLVTAFTLMPLGFGVLCTCTHRMGSCLLYLAFPLQCIHAFCSADSGLT